MTKYKIAECKVVDTETGEVKNIDEIDDVRAGLIEQGGYIRTPEQVKYAVEYRKRREDQTDFIWVKFQYNQPFHPLLQLKNIPKLICLATFINDEGFAMFKQDINSLLFINKNPSLDLRKELEQYSLISYVGDKIFVSRANFYRGDMEATTAEHIRLFTGATQLLYKSCPVKKHKQLSYIFKMIPFVNRQTNILSTNQQEQDISRIEPMTIQEFCKLLGYDVSHASRLRDDLLQFRIRGELVVGFYDDRNNKELNRSGKYIVVNPILFYGGDKSKNYYNDIHKLFITEKRNAVTIQ